MRLNPAVSGDSLIYMSKFEKPPGWTELPESQTGDNRPNESQGGEKFDKSYNAMMGELHKNGDSNLAELLAGLSNGTKAKLAETLELNGRDWLLLSRLGKENSQTVTAQIAEWESKLKETTNMQSRDAINRLLMDALERL